MDFGLERPRSSRSHISDVRCKQERLLLITLWVSAVGTAHRGNRDEEGPELLPAAHSKRDFSFPDNKTLGPGLLSDLLRWTPSSPHTLKNTLYGVDDLQEHERPTPPLCTKAGLPNPFSSRAKF